MRTVPSAEYKAVVCDCVCVCVCVCVCKRCLLAVIKNKLEIPVHEYSLRWHKILT